MLRAEVRVLADQLRDAENKCSSQVGHACFTSLHIVVCLSMPSRGLHLYTRGEHVTNHQPSTLQAQHCMLFIF